MFPTLLLASLAHLAATTVEIRPLASPPAHHLPAPTAGAVIGCDDGSAAGTLVEKQDHYYGNRFSAPCTGVRLTAARFTHSGPARSGGYVFRLHLLDGECREIGVTPELVTAADGAPATQASVDLGDYDWCIEGSFALLLEPLSTAGTGEVDDCYPALVVDATSDAVADAHCAIVNAPTADGRQCLAARSSDGRFFDFGLQVEAECGAPECTTAVEPGTWSSVKLLYRDSSAGSAE